MTLDNLAPQSTAHIKHIPPEVPQCRRLHDLGFIRGSKIKALFQNPSKTATAYQISCSVIALRASDAKNIEIEK